MATVSPLARGLRYSSRAGLRAGHGLWRSLVAHPSGGREAAGSNPASPTRTGRYLLNARCRWVTVSSVRAYDSSTQCPSPSHVDRRAAQRRCRTRTVLARGSAGTRPTPHLDRRGPAPCRQASVGHLPLHRPTTMVGRGANPRRARRDVLGARPPHPWSEQQRRLHVTDPGPRRAARPGCVTPGRLQRATTCRHDGGPTSIRPTTNSGDVHRRRVVRPRGRSRSAGARTLLETPRRVHRTTRMRWITFPSLAVTARCT